MTREGWETAFEAARAGDRATVLSLLDADRSLVHARDTSGATLLHVAAELGDEELAIGLLERGADAEVEASWGQTAFEWAANLGSSAVARLLRARGGARESLWTAAALGEVAEVADRLSHSREAPDLPRPLPVGPHASAWPDDTALRRRDGVSDAFYIACRNGHLSVARLLAQAGADVDARGYFGASALHWAAINGHRAVVRWLIEEGAERGERDPRFDATPAGWAREGGHHELAALLVGAPEDERPEEEAGR